MDNEGVDDNDAEEEGVAEVGEEVEVVAEVDVGDSDVDGVVVAGKEGDEEGVAVVIDGVGVDAGDVRPPYVQTPSVPSGILGP